jgi:aerobic carbon-monoxide dehydrogenase large subunit
MNGGAPSPPARGDGIGSALPRIEDPRLLLGQGRYVADLSIPGELYCAFVRASRAHAVIAGLNVAAARACPGVVAVLSGGDMAADGVGPMSCLWAIRSQDGSPMIEPPRWALARDRVRHIGEPIAVVVAETRLQALDAAEAVEVAYTPLAAVVDASAAVAAQAPRLHEAAVGNVCFRWQRGDRLAVERQLHAAHHVTRLELVNNRLIGAAIEPRAVVAAATADGVTLYSTTQVPHKIRRLVAEELGMAEAALRVIAPDVGGGFGYKGKHYPEETVLAWIARRLRRPAKWIATRAESFVADYQGRDHATRAELALDAHGHFLALRVETIANLGAYVSTFGAAIPSAIYGSLLAGVYRTPAVFVECTGVFTNTLPTDAYRGAGRPEACYLLERLADRAARELGIDRVAIRRRNLIPRAAMPYKTPLGPTYDCGDFAKLLARAVELADYAGFEGRRQAAAAAGKLRGLGLACYVESSGVAPSRLAGQLGARSGFFEAATIRAHADGSLTAMLGTHSHGQGMRRRSRRFSRQNSAFPSARYRSSKAIPISSRLERVPSARERSPSAARRWPWRRSS